ncbi:polymer-forming cytoskeletal protein [Alphaproteobacteria bacterium]|nr:polymer-forming cytoskeletal protein [Alphaproteobacteria bacterium]
MFNNSKKDNVMKTPGPSKGIAPSLLSSDLTITGNLESEGDMQIDGTIDGDIKSFTLTVSESGVIRGTVDAEEVTIAGSVTGQIKARHVILVKGAKVIADLIQDRLSIEPGAFFEGNCRQYPDENEPEAIQLEYDDQA